MAQNSTYFEAVIHLHLHDANFATISRIVEALVLCPLCDIDDHVVSGV